EGRRAARHELGVGDGQLLLGTVTRLAPQKDPVTLIRAAALVMSRHPETRLVIVGEGPMQAAVEQQLCDLGITDRVQLLGVRRDVSKLLAAMDVFVLPSRWEGAPRAIVEAMAAGVPVVATDVGGVGELVIN